MTNVFQRWGKNFIQAKAFIESVKACVLSIFISDKAHLGWFLTILLPETHYTNQVLVFVRTFSELIFGRAVIRWHVTPIGVILCRYITSTYNFWELTENSLSSLVILRLEKITVRFGASIILIKNYEIKPIEKDS